MNSCLHDLSSWDTRGNPKVFRGLSGKMPVTITVIQDEVTGPDDMGCGRIYSFNRRHNSFLELQAHATGNKDEARKELARKFPGYIELGYFEHGNCIWFPAENSMPPGTAGDFRWDGRMFAGVWVPWNVVWDAHKDKDEASRHALLLQMCTRDCEVYTAWCNGDLYEFKVDAAGVEDCWYPGYVGWDEVIEGIEEFLQENGIQDLEPKL